MADVTIYMVTHLDQTDEAQLKAYVHDRAHQNLRSRQVIMVHNFKEAGTKENLQNLKDRFLKKGFPNATDLPALNGKLNFIESIVEGQ